METSKKSECRGPLYLDHYTLLVPRVLILFLQGLVKIQSRPLQVYRIYYYYHCIQGGLCSD
jgi:hypothetical protein